MDPQELATRFDFHPATEHTGPLHEQIRAAGRAMAEVVVALTPESREQSLAVTAIEEAMMWANAAIARRSA